MGGGGETVHRERESGAVFFGRQKVKRGLLLIIHILWGSVSLSHGVSTYSTYLSIAWGACLYETQEGSISLSQGIYLSIAVRIYLSVANGIHISLSQGSVTSTCRRDYLSL